ncbi:hypothetical protein GNY06_09615 [Elizabethkingia argentiflava]|uniref:Alpha-2-macroglobulin domain-containing protein n=2 Tax=Elizabethkingia argenteiflava TaxID=2681556 RepID=A0A845PTR0_9FLAO|nr:hypothetical protein [Elizabethkingia argenteiflava]
MHRITKIFSSLLVVLWSISLYAQNYYEKQWKQINDNYAKGMVKSNMPLVLDIQKQAMKDNNTIELIKALKAEFVIVNNTEDDETNNIVSRFFDKIKKSSVNLKGEDLSIYNVLQLQFINDYFQQHIWKIREISNLDAPDFSQIETWSKLDFKKYLTQNFEHLEKEKERLSKISLKKYKELFLHTDNIDYFPSLQDWLSIKYIDFLESPLLFTPNELKQNYPKIIDIYNDRITANQYNSKLFFEYQKAQKEVRFQLLSTEQALRRYTDIVNSSTEGDYKVYILNDIANFLVAKKPQEALEWVERAKKIYPKSEFQTNVKNTENSILEANITIHYEAFTLPEQPIHLSVGYKNTDAFALDIYKVTDLQSFINSLQNSYKYPLLKVSKQWVRRQDYKLKNFGDYKNHLSSVALAALKNGIYIAEYFVGGASQGSYWFCVNDSRIIYSKKTAFQKNNILRLIDRNTGEPRKNADLKLYDYSDPKKTKLSGLKTDSQGNFIFPENPKGEYRQYLVEDPISNSISFTGGYGGVDYADALEAEDQKKAQIFLDRAVYRPGQTVYFKVINTRYQDKKESVAAGIKQSITLQDANGEALSKQSFTANEFGSYYGSFMLPKGKLNGDFSLNAGDGRAIVYFKVEEYKRPNFEISFEDIKGEYSFGQTLHLKGKAVSFSDTPLRNATLNYEIKKQDIRYRYFPGIPLEAPENSILGGLKTDKEGRFEIPIELQKDKRLKGIQVNEYQVSASITDINGETQQNNTHFFISSVSHFIEVGDVKSAFTNEEIKLKVATKNYNGHRLEKKYELKLALLQAPKRIFRDNFQNFVQDVPILTPSNFVRKFPHDYFNKGELPENRKIQRVVLQKSSADTLLNLGKLEAGSYKLELFNIEGQDTIKTERIFEVWDQKKLSEQQKPFFRMANPQKDYLRGEKAKIYLYSAIAEAKVYIYIQNGKGDTHTQERYIKNGVLEYEVPIPEDPDINSLNIQFVLAAYNDVQSLSIDLLVRDTAEPMKIELMTFRDKLQPGSQEKWKVKIKGENKDKIPFELLANMYDASLDQFAVNTYIFHHLRSDVFLRHDYSERYQDLKSISYYKEKKHLSQRAIELPDFNWFIEERIGRNRIMGRVVTSLMRKEATNDKHYTSSISMSSIEEGHNLQKDGLQKVPVRRNLNETAFFYPNLRTDKDGYINFEFTSPEALTQWKLMLLAHDKNARAATLERTIVTRKDFSLTPNYPRFLREGDEMKVQVKLDNQSPKTLSGQVQLQVLDADTEQDISSKLGISNAIQSFNMDGSSSLSMNWKLKIPERLSGVVLKAMAKAGAYTDGEQKAIPVLPNRMLVTDAQPVFVREKETKTFSIKDQDLRPSSRLTSISNTLELTLNPIWQVLLALPSLKENVHHSADVVFNKWFADVLASEIFKANPRLKTVFEKYHHKDLLKSKLEKNQELKKLLLEETPWVLQAKDEKQQMQLLARLFDTHNMRYQTMEDWRKLSELQNSDGGFSWYPGAPSSFSTSLYILKNWGKISEWLKDKGGIKAYQAASEHSMIAALVAYVDRTFALHPNTKNRAHWDNMELDYLDSRSYWEPMYPLENVGKNLKVRIIHQAQTLKFADFSFFGLTRAALLFNRYGLKEVADRLLTYMKETATDTKTQGVYWKQNLNDWGWYSSKVINQALALQAFNELRPSDPIIEEMKTWLITQKEVNHWETSRATAEIIYTIINSGKDWTATSADSAKVIWAGKDLNKTDIIAPGYIKKTLVATAENKRAGEIVISKPGPGIIQGGIFWQYYENLDNIKSSATHVAISKELYKKVKTENGEELKKITTETPIQIGDRISVRMLLNVDRPMEYIHVKDMRASGFEPADPISGYRFQGNLGYYQSTKDASTHFYIQYMPKGKYVLEYDIIANVVGKFSNGVTTIQSYYAPQMNAHTPGMPIEIKP